MATRPDSEKKESLPSFTTVILLLAAAGFLIPALSKAVDSIGSPQAPLLIDH